MGRYNDFSYGEWPLCHCHTRVRKHITALCRFLEAAWVLSAGLVSSLFATTGVRHSVRSALLRCRGAERKVLRLTQAIWLNSWRHTIVLSTQSSLMLVAQDRK